MRTIKARADAPQLPPICEIAGCNRPRVTQTMCAFHRDKKRQNDKIRYQQYKQQLGNNQCHKRGCTNPLTTLTLCSFHRDKQRESSRRFQQRSKEQRQTSSSNAQIEPPDLTRPVILQPTMGGNAIPLMLPFNVPLIIQPRVPPVVLPFNVSTECRDTCSTGCINCLYNAGTRFTDPPSPSTPYVGGLTVIKANTEGGVSSIQIPFNVPFIVMPTNPPDILPFNYPVQCRDTCSMNCINCLSNAGVQFVDPA